MPPQPATASKNKTINSWDIARRRLLKRTNTHSRFLAQQSGEIAKPEPLDRGVNYFVLMLEHLQLTSEWSCSGHGNNQSFYITFNADYLQALVIKSLGYFTVEVEGANYWTLRFSYRHNSARDRNRTLRWAASAWERAFGSLDTQPPTWAELIMRLMPGKEEAVGEETPDRKSGADSSTEVNNHEGNPECSSKTSSTKPGGVRKRE